jgi:hypothetical protein
MYEVLRSKLSLLTVDCESVHAVPEYVKCAQQLNAALADQRHNLEHLTYPSVRVTESDTKKPTSCHFVSSYINYSPKRAVTAVMFMS